MRKILIIGTIIVIFIIGFFVAGTRTQGQTDSLNTNQDLNDKIPDDMVFITFDGQGPGYGPGPAPNSGDGIPDGPGW